MFKTQCDLSADKVKLDYRAMLDVAIIAYVETRNNLSGLIGESYNRGTSSMDLANLGQRLSEMAKKFELASEMLNVLEEGLNRSKLEIVNKKSVKAK